MDYVRKLICKWDNLMVWIQHILKGMIIEKLEDGFMQFMRDWHATRIGNEKLNGKRGG